MSVKTTRDQTAVRGADAFVQASAAAGIEICFANAGTSELAIVDALRRSKIRSVQTLFEGVTSGAADGYARMKGQPASVLLHLGVGFSYAASNLHEARRQRVPIVVWVGDHPSSLLALDPPGSLRRDVAETAAAVSTWVRRIHTTETIAADAGAAVAAARARPRGVATLIVPTDVSYAEMPAGGAVLPAPGASHTATTADLDVVDATARRLREAKRPLILLGGQPVTPRDLANAHAIADSSGGSVLLECRPCRIRIEPGSRIPERLNQDDVTKARSQLAHADLVVLAGTRAPAPYYMMGPGPASLIPAGVEVVDLAGPEQDAMAILAGIRESLGARPHDGAGRPRTRTDGPPLGTDLAAQACSAIAAHLPEDAVVVTQGMVGSRSLFGALLGSSAHDYMACGGGAMGFAIPAATGAAIAAPGRRVVAISGDGAAAYVPQALWTHARERLDITTIVLVNNAYQCLRDGFDQQGWPLEGANDSLTDLTQPVIDWPSLAAGFGVPASCVRDIASLRSALVESFATPGPRLIAMILDPNPR